MPDFTGAIGGQIAAAWISGIGMGWGLCYAILVKSMQVKQDKLESRLDAIEAANHTELIELRKKAMGQ